MQLVSGRRQQCFTWRFQILRPGKKYSRSDVSELLSLGNKAKSGVWISGIREHEGEFFIFTNVGTAGTIGGDNSNRWDGERLKWYHKKNSHRDWPSVRKLLDAGRAHVFWRPSAQDLFEYAGYGQIAEVSGSAPVGILWSFDGSAVGSSVLHSLGVLAQEGTAADRQGLEIGDRIRHPDHGLGRLLTFSADSEVASATVFFGGLRERRETPLSEVEKVAGFGPA